MGERNFGGDMTRHVGGVYLRGWFSVPRAGTYSEAVRCLACGVSVLVEFDPSVTGLYVGWDAVKHAGQLNTWACEI